MWYIIGRIVFAIFVSISKHNVRTGYFFYKFEIKITLPQQTLQTQKKFSSETQAKSLSFNYSQIVVSSKKYSPFIIYCMDWISRESIVNTISYYTKTKTKNLKHSMKQRYEYRECYDQTVDMRLLFLFVYLTIKLISLFLNVAVRCCVSFGVSY